MTSPTVNPAHIDCNAQLFRAHRTLADAIKRAEAAEAELAKTREHLGDVLRERAKMAERLAARPAANGATSDGRRRVTWNRRPGDTIAHLYVEKVTVCAVPVADVEKAAAVLETVINGIVAIERARLTGTGDDVRDAFIGAATDAARAMNGEAARPAAESVAVPPEVRVVSNSFGAFSVMVGDTTFHTSEYRTSADSIAQIVRRAFDAAAHWPRAVSSEEVERLRAERDDLIERHGQLVEAALDHQAAREEAESLCNALMSAGIAECERLRGAILVIADDGAEMSRLWRRKYEEEKANHCEAVRREAAARAQGAAEERGALLGTDQPYTVLDCLTQLADAAQHLLSDHDCDAHGWEGVTYVMRAARAHADRIRARAAAAGAEGQTSGTTPAEQKGQDDGAGREISREERLRGVRQAEERHADVRSPAAGNRGGMGGRGDGDSQRSVVLGEGEREQRVASPPPCAACGGSGCVDCVGLAPPPASDEEIVERVYARAAPNVAKRRLTASSATAGEDEVEARALDWFDEHLGAAEWRGPHIQSFLSLVRSERRRAYERAAKEAETWGPTNTGCDKTIAARIRALGGEEGGST